MKDQQKKSDTSLSWELGDQQTMDIAELNAAIRLARGALQSAKTMEDSEKLLLMISAAEDQLRERLECDGEDIDGYDYLYGDPPSDDIQDSALDAVKMIKVETIGDIPSKDGGSSIERAMERMQPVFRKTPKTFAEEMEIIRNSIGNLKSDEVWVTGDRKDQDVLKQANAIKNFKECIDRIKQNINETEMASYPVESRSTIQSDPIPMVEFEYRMEEQKDNQKRYELYSKSPQISIDGNGNLRIDDGIWKKVIFNNLKEG